MHNAALHHAVDYTLYEGIEVAGWLAHCLSRGELVVENGRYLDPPIGRGQFLTACLPLLRSRRGPHTSSVAMMMT
jgi:dihydropyrimidinase